MAKPGLVRTFVASVLPGILKPLRVLWNEIIAFFFFVMAVVLGVPSAYRAIRGFNGQIEELGKVILTCLFVLVMGGYGFYSFFRARKINKSGS